MRRAKPSGLQAVACYGLERANVTEVNMEFLKADLEPKRENIPGVKERD